jgi:hypothetical protein
VAAVFPQTARAVPPLSKSETPPGGWLRALARGQKNLGVNVLASKLACIAWAVLRRQDTFDPGAMALA